MFKSWTWKQWVAVAIVAAVVITLLVLHFVNPAVTFAFVELASLVTFVLGVVTGYLLKKNNIINEK